MNQWKEILEYCLNKNLAKIILSNPRQKDGIRKVEIRPVLLKGNLLFQASAYTQKQVQHYNLTEKEVYEKTAGWMENMKQLEALHPDGRVHVKSLGKRQDRFLLFCVRNLMPRSTVPSRVI